MVLRTSGLVLLGLAVVTGCATRPPPSANDGAESPSLQRRDGELSRVHLLRVWRLDETTAGQRQAPGGIGFEFLVVPNSDGAFTLTELRDATIDGRSYQAISSAQLGSPIEPNTVIANPDDVRVFDGQTAQSLSAGSDRAVVMRTLLFGAQLPSTGILVVRPDVGFGKVTEPFEFEVRLDSVSSGPEKL